MKVATAQEMRDIDQRAINEYKIPGIVLMENAGLQVVRVVLEKMSGVQGRTVTIFAGKGNNGGDGLVAARHLFNMGADVKVLLMRNPDDISGDAAVNLEIWRRMGQKVYTVTQKDDFNAVRLFLVRTDIVVDAIYGTGFRGTVKEYAGRIIEAINASGKPVVAVDIPSGVDADIGSVGGPCIKASVTVTFGIPKLGLLLDPGAGYTGEMRVADISLPPSLLSDELIKGNLIEPSLVRSWLPLRPCISHKGDYGRVLVIAGSRGMAGAACLTAGAAVRAGAGLVTLAVPEGIYGPVASKLTEVMVVPVPQTEGGTLSGDAITAIRGLMERADVLAMGPGLSSNPETVDAVQKIISLCHVPAVLDADGLNACAGSTDLFKNFRKPLVLTPHPGEMARLCGTPVDSIQRERLQTARAWSSAWDSVLVLKGAKTIVALPDGTVYINNTGNPGMATGGSGDVLTGMVAGIMAQGVDAAGAAAAAVYIHGLAGDMAAREKGMMGLSAGDILDYLPLAGRYVEGQEN